MPLRVTGTTGALNVRGTGGGLASKGAAPTGPSPVAGTKAPVFGAGAQDPFPAAGWTSVVSSSEDDTSRQVVLPFTWNFNGTGYTSFFPGSNTYITFGAGSGVYAGLSAAYPNYNKIHIASSDNSWQRVSSYTSGTDYVRLRYEGTASAGGTPGYPNIVYEITFFNPALTGGNSTFELLVGSQNRAGGGVSGIYSTSSLLTGGGFGPSLLGAAANQSYVAVGDATGTTWTVYTGYYMAGTNY